MDKNGYENDEKWMKMDQNDKMDEMGIKIPKMNGYENTKNG
jgi:hypothetical protein